jgi:hypothetical protein
VAEAIAAIWLFVEIIHRIISDHSDLPPGQNSERVNNPLRNWTANLNKYRENKNALIRNLICYIFSAAQSFLALYIFIFNSLYCILFFSYYFID